MIGQTISHYKIIEKIGQGGMGVVYRAEDTNLSRDVAIKVLPEQFTQDPQRLARFEREAKLLASLNHPNIAAIHSFEHADEIHFLVLELVPGETLAEKVAKGPLPVEEALEVCRQIAEGVEAAHEKGVIHRDLKPANVKVTPEGKVKILDFGLAKAFEGEIPAADISQSPTLTEEMTRAGVILGTAAYMSPEQAKGKPVDNRTDIFAFGSVLYELLTGRRAFEGETVTDTLARVLQGEPDWKAVPGATPWRIQELLQRCLTKDPGDRLLNVGEARIQIKKALEEPATESPAAVASAVQPAQQRWGMIVGLVVVTAVVVGVAVWLLIQPSSPEQRLNRFVITPTSTAPLRTSGWNDLAISPDGRHFVYVANIGNGTQLYLRSLDDFVDRPILGTEGVVGSPFFSPDGESVGFFAGGSLKKVSLAGGSPITLCEAINPARGGSWGHDDTIVFTAGGEGAPGLYRVPAAGGEREFLGNGNPGPGENGYNSPHLLPDGTGVLASLYLPPSDYRTELVSLDTGERKIILEHAKDAMYVDTGHLIYEQAGTGNLMAVPFDLTSLEVTSDPVPVLQGVRGDLPGYVDYAVSDDGTLVYIPGGSTTSHQHGLVWVDREGVETPVTQEKKDYRVPRISPDGKLISLAIGDPGTANQVWIYDLEAESLSRLTFEEERSGSSAWSPDSERLVFQSGGTGEGGLVWQPVDRSLPQERLTSTKDTPGGRQMPSSWSHDGQFLGGVTGSFDIGILPLEGEKEPEFIIASPAMECCPKFSPDGKWLAYVSDETGTLQVYVRPFPGPEVKWLISDENEGGAQPVWSPDGTELFYRSGNRTMVVSIRTQGQTLTAGTPKVLFEGQYVSHSQPPGFQYYDISPDGKQFLMLKEDTAQDQAQINVILNWFEELKRLVSTE
jgi:serine/threonine-protein kinase